MGLISGDDAKAATARGAAATNTTDALAAEAGPALPWLSQFVILLKRCFLAHRLDLVDPMLLANMFSVMLLSAALWSGQGSKRPRTETSVRDISGLLFLSCVYWAFQLMILALYTFPADRVVVTKERAAGLYSISAYFLARTSVDTLTTVLMSPDPIIDLLLRRGPATVGRRLAFAHAISELTMCPLRGTVHRRVDHEFEARYDITNGLHAGDDDVRRVLRARRAYVAQVVRRLEFHALRVRRAPQGRI